MLIHSGNSNNNLPEFSALFFHCCSAVVSVALYFCFLPRSWNQTRESAQQSTFKRATGKKLHLLKNFTRTVTLMMWKTGSNQKIQREMHVSTVFTLYILRSAECVFVVRFFWRIACVVSSHSFKAMERDWNRAECRKIDTHLPCREIFRRNNSGTNCRLLYYSTEMCVAIGNLWTNRVLWGRKILSHSDYFNVNPLKRTRDIFQVVKHSMGFSLRKFKRNFVGFVVCLFIRWWAKFSL